MFEIMVLFKDFQRLQSPPLMMNLLSPVYRLTMPGICSHVSDCLSSKANCPKERAL